MYTQEDIRKVQLRLLEMATAVRDILEHHNLPYFMAYGTLLGAVRHQGFIPWDDDFDFYLFDDTYQQAIQALRSQLPPQLFVEDGDSEPLYFHGWAHVKDLRSITHCEQYPQDGYYSHHGISLDLYRIKQMKSFEVKDYQAREYIAYLNRRKALNMISDDDYQQRMKPLLNRQPTPRTAGDDRRVLATTLPILEQIDLDEVLPLKRLTFEGTQFLAPCHPETFLSLRYGNDYMQLPPENQRVPHYSGVEFL